MQSACSKLARFMSLLFKRRSTKIYVLLILLVMFGSTFAVYSYVLLTSTVIIGTRGSVKALYFGVYWDDECNNPVLNIDWGIVEPGSSANVTVYLRNEGNAPMRIALNVTNWYPPNASDYMRLEWDYSGQILQPDETTRIVLSLIISPDVTSVADFALDILITPFD